ncbi:031c68b4-9375-49ab-9189-0b415b5ab89a [Thermothielavioides terrestris]|uniref:031c68b4-9375-49ab-9189-0b415b5ab89a n=1 Tax=Thermothielavioides terrestris TaxID=2587410 RepID=A0A3S4B7E9_9PEZI|nr:031c68b4-9375-49ab-9189-0b415b5ab89a [Thermothielavioides terrestris]
MLTRLLNKLLTALHLRRPSPWDPPTVLDWLLTSPLQHLTALLYRHVLLPLRGAPFRPAPGRRPIRVVCLSDTHGRTALPPAAAAGGGVPAGDLLVHCGDLTDGGTAAEIQAQIDWLRALPHRWKVVVGGNHDVWLDAAVRGQLGEKEGGGVVVDFSGVEYLCDRAVELEFEGGRRLNVYGWGAVPWCGEGFAYQYEREKHPWEGRIPEETDVLVTHTPPRHHLDLGLGCAGLLDEVWRVKPKLHVFGHVHWGHGTEAVYYDECQRAYESLMSRPARGLFYDLIPSMRWVDAFNVLYYGVGNILWKWIMLGPGSNNGALMANASVMYGNTGKLGNPAIVVDL